MNIVAADSFVHIQYKAIFLLSFLTQLLDLVLVNGQKLIGMLCKQTSYKMVKSKHTRKERNRDTRMIMALVMCLTI